MVANLIPWRRRKEDTRLTRMPRSEESPFLALHRHWDELFDEFFRDVEETLGLPALRQWSGAREGLAAPRVDLSETEDEYMVNADLPGLEEKDVEVTLDNDALAIKGQRQEEHEEKKRDYHLMERSYGEFRRSIPLPHGVDTEKVKASFKNGVLRVHLPKSPEARAHRKVIAISEE